MDVADGVLVRLAVAVAVNVGVTVSVRDGVDVAVDVADGVLVRLAVAVAVNVGVTQCEGSLDLVSRFAQCLDLVRLMT